MKTINVAEMSMSELQDKLVELKSELFNLRFQHAINQLENTARIRLVKRDIARVKTAISSLELKENA